GYTSEGIFGSARRFEVVPGRPMTPEQRKLIQPRFEMLVAQQFQEMGCVDASSHAFLYAEARRQIIEEAAEALRTEESDLLRTMGGSPSIAWYQRHVEFLARKHSIQILSLNRQDVGGYANWRARTITIKRCSVRRESCATCR